ncbi:FAD-dependent oxidoreductase [Glycomyces dulcitolivorans]|uniref:FAD-dependent oxidoreductase n=1 Tax=Glycomyces dulcitolivorans TaxID=2200759 RepID=UPI000DD39570|nr:NAD(P)/FAD-dependent oxidoreductase [Glycomyces dulcitolivorans]
MISVGIIGGGIGGLCLAQGLVRAGIDVHVFERDEHVTAREQGYRLHIDPHGSAALHECLPEPLWNAFTATAGDPGTGGFGFLDERLATMCLVEDEVFRGGLTDPARGHHAASRITLRRILLAGLGERVRFGAESTGFERLADGRVRADFADGGGAEFDLLVGADGAKSRLRRQLLPGAERVAAGAMGIGGKLPLEGRDWLPDRLTGGLNVVMPPRDFLFTAVFKRRRTTEEARALLSDDVTAAGLDADELFGGLEQQDYLMWAFVLPAGAADTEAGGAELRDLVLRRAAGWDERLQRILAESRPETINAFGFQASTRPRPWSTGNVTLLGDAIHSMPPTGGVGANTALRDAANLCRALTDAAAGTRPLIDAVADYERQMLAYGFEAVDVSMSRARQATAGRLARTGARGFMRLCGTVPPLRRAVFKSSWTDAETARPQAA